MALGVAHDLDPSAASDHFVALRHALASVVGALRLDVGPDLANEGAHIGLCKYHDRVHVRQGGDNFGTFILGHYWAAISLDFADTLVGIQRHDQLAAERFSPAKVAHVPNMQRVEAAVGEYDLFACTSPFVNALP